MTLDSLAIGGERSEQFSVNQASENKRLMWDEEMYFRERLKVRLSPPPAARLRY